MLWFVIATPPTLLLRGSLSLLRGSPASAHANRCPRLVRGGLTLIVIDMAQESQDQKEIRSDLILT